MQVASQAQVFNDPVMLSALVFAVAGPTVFAFSAVSYTSKTLKPSINSAYSTLQPVLVAITSLLLYGTGLTNEEIACGFVVIVGLNLSIIGNPRVDRAWSEYVSNLPTNVPQSIACVADAGVEAVVTVTGKVREITSDVYGKASDVMTQSTDILDAQKTKVRQAIGSWQSVDKDGTACPLQLTKVMKSADGMRVKGKDVHKSR
jgi:hypothetical protein